MKDSKWKEKFFPQVDLNDKLIEENKPEKTVKFVSESFKYETRKTTKEKTMDQHLKDMGHFFELDEKKVSFYINQLKASVHL